MKTEIKICNNLDVVYLFVDKEAFYTFSVYGEALANQLVRGIQSPQA